MKGVNLWQGVGGGRWEVDSKTLWAVGDWPPQTGRRREVSPQNREMGRCDPYPYHTPHK